MSKIQKPRTSWEFCVYPALKKWLEASGMNQITIAPELNTTQFTLSSWTRGAREPTVQFLLALEDMTGLTFRELFGECEGRKR